MFTFNMLDNTAEMEGSAVTFAKAGIGNAFTKWFPQDPPTNAVVPRQMAYLLWANLQRVHEHLQAGEETRKVAVTAYVALTSDAKRLRISAS